MVDEAPFFDVLPVDGGFSLPELKWRELVFVGALRADGDAFVRDPARPLPLFAFPDLFPEGRRFSAERRGDRVVLRSVPSQAAPGADGLPV
jgi:hypothetical protein